MNKTIFFDTGPLISLVMARLSWILPHLKKHFQGEFYITPAVKYELVDRPLTVKRFKFEALESLKLIREGTLKVYDKVPKTKVLSLKNLANSSFKMRGKTMDVLQEGEVQAVASALQTPTSTVVMDERTLRLFIENNKELKKLLERRFHSKIIANKERMDKFSQLLKKVNIIRSIELVAVAYKLGLLDSYVPKLKGGKRLLLDSVLWTVKFKGCAVNEHEIEEIKSFLLK